MAHFGCFLNILESKMLCVLLRLFSWSNRIVLIVRKKIRILAPIGGGFASPDFSSAMAANIHTNAAKLHDAKFEESG